MSQAFRKEGDAPEESPERPVPQGPNYVTPAGLAALEEKARALAARRPAAGEDERRAIDRDLRYCEARLSSALLVDNSRNPPPDVRFGARVETREGETTRRYAIVGQDEADPARGLLSWSSPLAMALLGAKAGDKVPFGDETLEVLSVSY